MAVRLFIRTQPGSTTLNQPLTIQPIIEAQNQNANGTWSVDTTFTGLVTANEGPGTSSSVPCYDLTGLRTIACVNGVATFTNLGAGRDDTCSFTGIQQIVTLVFTSANLHAALSDPFIISQEATRLTVTNAGLFSNAVSQREIRPPILVQVQDNNNNNIPSPNLPVVVSVSPGFTLSGPGQGENPSPATPNPPISRLTDNNGLASFNGLRLNGKGIATLTFRIQNGTLTPGTLTLNVSTVDIIKPMRSTEAGKVPTVSDLENNEIAINLTDRVLYARNDDTIVPIGGGIFGLTTGKDSGTPPLAEFRFDGHLIPTQDIAFDIGSSTKAWRDLYLSGNSIKIGGKTLSADDVEEMNKFIGSLCAPCTLENNKAPYAQAGLLVRVPDTCGAECVFNGPVGSVLMVDSGLDNKGVNVTFPRWSLLTLDSIVDCEIGVATQLSHGDILQYDKTRSLWVNTVSVGGGGATTLNGLSDVDVSGATNKQILEFNGTEWRAVNPTALDIKALTPLEWNSSTSTMKVQQDGAAPGNVLTWAQPPGESSFRWTAEPPTAGGTVTSVGLTSSSLTIGSPSTITTSGKFVADLQDLSTSAGGKLNPSGASFTNANITVDKFGRITDVSNGSAGSGSGAVNSVTLNSTTLTIGGGNAAQGTVVITANLPDIAGITPNTTFTNANVKVDAQGRVIEITNGTAGTGGVTSVASPNNTITTTTTNGAVTVDLPATGVSAGKYTLATVTIDAQGRVTAADNGTSSGGAVNLNALEDVTLGGLTNGSLLKFDSADSQWKNVDGTTTNINEGANLYFTQARSRGVLSAGTGVVYDSTTGVISMDPAGGGGVGVVNLDDLADVTAPAPTDGQFLMWSSAQAAWIPFTFTGGGSTGGDGGGN